MSIFKKVIGLHGRNDRDDVLRLERLLHQAGYLDTGKTEGATGWFGMRLEQAIKSFQKDRGLKRDGIVSPGKETEIELASALERKQRRELRKKGPVANPDDAYFPDNKKDKEWELETPPNIKDQFGVRGHVKDLESLKKMKNMQDKSNPRPGKSRGGGGGGMPYKIKKHGPNYPRSWDLLQ